MRTEPYYYVIDDDYKPISGALDTLTGAIALATFELLERTQENAVLIVGQDSQTWREDIPCPFYFKLQPLEGWKEMVK